MRRKYTQKILKIMLTKDNIINIIKKDNLRDRYVNNELNLLLEKSRESAVKPLTFDNQSQQDANNIINGPERPTSIKYMNSTGTLIISYKDYIIDLATRNANAKILSNYKIENLNFKILKSTINHGYILIAYSNIFTYYIEVDSTRVNLNTYNY